MLMLPLVILPETLTRQSGAGEAVALETSGRPVVLMLDITRVLEYEFLNLSIAGSADGIRWRKLCEFPPESYCGIYSMRLDLSGSPDVLFLRAEWSVERWTADASPPLFEFSVSAAAAASV